MCSKCNCGTATDDFRWPYVVHDGAFGPWEEHCQSEVLKPEFPICFNPSQPSNFKDIVKVLSDALLSVTNLCPNDYSTVASDNVLLVNLNYFLSFNWIKPYHDLNNVLKNGIYHHVYVIIKESIVRDSYVYMDKVPALKDTLKVIRDNLVQDGWSITEARIERVVGLIFEFGTNVSLLSERLNTIILSDLDTSWVSVNNESYLFKCDHSLKTINDLAKQNLTLVETLKRYSITDGVILFDINKCTNSNFVFNISHGNSRFSIRNVKDLVNMAKAIFAS